MTPASDPIVAAPDRLGPAGRGWRIQLDKMREALAIPAEDTAPIAGWIVEVPGAHPLWHSYWLSLIHLRPQKGFMPAVLHRPDATHELILFALDPSFPREPMLTSAPARYLLPPNFLAQLAEPTDAGAIEIADSAVDRMVAGTLNPDTDYIRQWIALFGDACIRPEHRR